MPTSINTNTMRLRAGRGGGAAALGLLLLGGGLAAAATPKEDPGPIIQGQVEIAITEHVPDKADAPPMKFLTGLTEGFPSEVVALFGQSRYQMKLWIDSHRAPHHLLICHLDVRGGNREAQLKATVPFRHGGRVALGRVARPDGSSLEVVATVR